MPLRATSERESRFAARKMRAIGAKFDTPFWENGGLEQLFI
jgi:hypothetical protein